VLALAEAFLEHYRQSRRPCLKKCIDCHRELATEIKGMFRLWP
jgi:hypothetical protein